MGLGASKPTLPQEKFYRRKTAQEQQDCKKSDAFFRQNKAVICARLEQALAEIGLASVDDQYPIKVLLNTEGGDVPLGNVVSTRINDYVSELTHEEYVPELDIASAVPVNLQTFLLTAGLETPLVDIESVLSSETAQGTVYIADIKPDERLLSTRVIDCYGLQKSVQSVLKKSPIYSDWLWGEYVNLSTLSDTELADKGYDPAQRSLLLEDIEFQLNEQYYSLNTEAMADALGYFLGSQLVGAAISPFYPLLYGTFRANDSSYSTPEKPFPVQLVFLQKLDGDLNKLVTKEHWFTDAAGNLDEKRALSLFAQVVFGLAIGQRTFSIVHNDFHGGNLLYEDVDPNHALYYRHGKKFYRVPTYGKVFKQTDFGRATFVLGGKGYGSEVQKNIFSDWDLQGMQNDLVRLTSVFLLITGRAGELTSGTGVVYTFLRNVLTCADGKTMFDRWKECETDKCRDLVLVRDPYTKSSACKGSTPQNNYSFFDVYEVPYEAIPPQAIVYTLP